MKRLTTDHPEENFDTPLNYVFSKDGWAYIRSDGESEDPILLTEWARRQCITRGCDGLPTDPEKIDESISDCDFYTPECPVFLSYTFACQAVHLRDRLKQIEDILGDNYDLNHLKELVQAENDGRLVVQKVAPGERIWTLKRDEYGEAYDIGGYMFLASVGQSIIVTPYINGITALEGTMEYHIKRTVEDYNTNLAVFPTTDCFITRKEAESALAEKG